MLFDPTLTEIESGDDDDDPCSQLCTLCASITISQLQADSGYIHHRDARQLPAIAQSCALCSLMLHDALQRPSASTLTVPTPHADFASVLEDLRISVSSHVSILLKWEDALVHCFLIEAVEDDEPLWHQLGRFPLRIFTTSTKSTGIIQLLLHSTLSKLDFRI